MIACILTLAATVPADNPNLGKDHTGVRWVLPFKKALAKADRENRLLFIKPIAGGSDAKGGW